MLTIRTAPVTLALLATLAATAPAVADSRARAARSEHIHESSRLHLTSKHGFTLNEEGNATGTIHGTIYIHLHLVASNRVTAEVNIYPSGGSLSGTGSASYKVLGASAEFSGSLSVTRGTGSYAGARAQGLRFTGSIARRDEAVSVELEGALSLR